MATSIDTDALFENNVKQINTMNIAAGSMIKGLIMELDRKNRATYIQLKDAEPDGHSVKYDFISGDPQLVERIASALGISVFSKDTLVVPHG